MRKLPIIVLLLTLLSCQNRNGEPIRLNGKAQGTYYSIAYIDEKGRNLQNEIDSLLDDFDETASLWVENSIIRRVNENRDSVVNELFAELTRLSVEMNKYTEGAFDCTVGQLVNAWGFSYKKRENIDQQVIDSLMKYCGEQPHIEKIDDGTIVLRKPNANTSLDFNAIAQGYSTDMICRFLENKGINNYIVDIGGEVRAKGTKKDGSDWIVGIERPAQERYDSPEIETSIALHDKAVVTSGNYRKYYEKDGVRYSHTIDPTTGNPVTHTLLSVTVIDTAAWRADALATAFMVMGLDRSLKFIEEHPNDSGTQAVLFISNDSTGYKIISTDKMKSLQTKQAKH